jgi:hypothetical protein
VCLRRGAGGIATTEEVEVEECCERDRVLTRSTLEEEGEEEDEGG